MQLNAVRHQLLEGRPSLGTWLALGSTLGAEWMAHQGLDWLGVEPERRPIGLMLTASLVRAIRTTDVVPLVRVPWKEPRTIGRALDAGALGLVFPTVETRDEAELCVRTTRQHQSDPRAAECGPAQPSSMADGAQQATEELLVVATIETAPGLRNLDEIMAVPGLDACFIAPHELCTAIGIEPSLEPTDPRFFEAIGAVYGACRRHGVAPGIQVRTAQRAIRHIDDGWQLIAIASDGDLMARAAASAALTVRQGLGRGSTTAPPPAPAGPDPIRSDT
jgi:4-hydroxy-2-oxoheptanedioate aldolase